MRSARWLPRLPISAVRSVATALDRRAGPFPRRFLITSVPLTLDAMLGADHVVNVHLSADKIDTYIACGEIGGRLFPEGAVIIGLRELNNSGFTGIACLARRRGRRLDGNVGLCRSNPRRWTKSRWRRRRRRGVRHPGMGGIDMGTPEASS